MKRAILELKGTVQGVGFRYHVVRIASRFEVRGTVRNTSDGAVEIDVEGDDDEVARFIDSVLRNPPRSARVDNVTEREAEPRCVSGFGVSR
jgi:acylphosphatase